MVRSRRALLAAFLVVSLTLATVPTTAVADSRAGGTVVVEEGETVTGLEAVGGTVIVRGTVDGDLEGLAGTIVVTGTVTGDVEASAGNVQIGGRVGGDVTAATGSFVLERNASIGGNLRVAAGSVHVEGSVGGFVESAADTTVLGPTASVGGDLRYSGDLERAAGATVAGTVTRDESLGVNVSVFGLSAPTIPGWTVALYAALVNFVVGAILLYAVPEFAGGVAERARETPLRSAGVGFLTLVAVPVALVLLLITVIGIPLSIVGVFAFVVLLWAGYVFGAYALGSWLCSLADVANRYAALALGLVAVTALSLVPWVGGLAEFVVFLLGLGALTWSLYRAVRDWRREDEEPATA
ncbi:MAG: polymer-forming cytoskeletal protein [Halobacteriaceae archaeon]